MAPLDKDTLEERQEAMRARKQREREQKEYRFVDRPLCMSCKKRYARVGQPYCSRCTATGMVNDLRDTLPGLPTQENSPDAYCETLNNGDCVSTDPRCMHQPKPAPPKDQNYTRSEAAEIIGVSATTLIRWEKKGVIPQPTRISHNNQCVYTKELIDAAVKYKSSEYMPPASVLPSGTSSLPRAVKVAKIDKRLEKSVARSLGSMGRLFR